MARKMFTARLPPDLLKRVAAYAAARGLTVTAVVEAALERELKDEK